MKNNKVSLCMIVKDEELLIRQCLASVENIVDEIIIVDTGSTDNTVQICQEFTEKIYHYQWDNHFSKARNFSISKATNDWILSLDADETLGLESKSELQEIITNTQAQRILLPVLIYYGDRLPANPDDLYTYYQARLFRNHIGFKYDKRIHETLRLPDATEEIIEEHISIPIHHFGYIKEIETRKEKSQRNLELLKLEAMSHERSPWILYHLGSEHYRIQDYSQAFAYINEAIYEFLLLNLKPPALFYRLKYAILIETNSLEGAWPAINKAVQLYPDYVDLLFYKAYILYKKKRYLRAKQIFEQCLSLGDIHPDYLILNGMGSFMAEEYLEKCNKKITLAKTKSKKNILYIGWLGFNNLGDELMYDLFKENVNRMDGNFHIDFVNYAEKYLQNIDITPFDLIVLGGGSIFSGPNYPIEPYIIQFLYDAIKAEKKVMIWGTGIDSLSEEAIAKIENKEKIDLNMPDRLIEKIKYVFKYSVWAGVRGPLSLSLFQSLGISENLQQSGDPGFLINQESNLEIQEKEKVIGVNWGTTYNSLYGGNEMQMEEQLVHTLNKLIEQNYKIYLYILWDEDIEASKRLYEKLNNPEMVILDTFLYDYHGLLPIVSKFKFTINFKMHASYLSLAAGTPFIALGYRFKVYDFIKSVQMEAFLIPTDTSGLCEKVLSLADFISENEHSIIMHMKTVQNNYVKKLMHPFEHHLFLEK